VAYYFQIVREKVSKNKMDDPPIVSVPAPWKLKGTVYLVTFFNKAGQLPAHAYSPLEQDSTFASPAASGKHLGGISQFQVIRYHESPVGPYDELIVCPGSFTFETEQDGKRKKNKAARISRIYVSQKHTCWNGRTSSLLPFSSLRQDLIDNKPRRLFSH